MRPRCELRTGSKPDWRRWRQAHSHLLSADEQRERGKELEEWRGKRFKTEYLPLVRPFSAVSDLLRRVRDAGLRIAVASSAKKDEVDKYLDIARITEWRT
jgi:phosphoglycolate phosphatase-like HAD superfamily hydrolase